MPTSNKQLSILGTRLTTLRGCLQTAGPSQLGTYRTAIFQLATLIGEQYGQGQGRLELLGEKGVDTRAQMNSLEAQVKECIKLLAECLVALKRLKDPVFKGQIQRATVGAIIGKIRSGTDLSDSLREIEAKLDSDLIEAVHELGEAITKFTDSLAQKLSAVASSDSPPLGYLESLSATLPPSIDEPSNSDDAVLSAYVDVVLAVIVAARGLSGILKNESKKNGA